MFDRCVDGRLAVVEAEPPLDNLIVGIAGSGRNPPGTGLFARLLRGSSATFRRMQVLVLNASYEPLNVTTVRRAHVLVFKGKAEVIEELDRPLRSATGRFQWPHVIRLVQYVRVPRAIQRKILAALFARDGWRCVYCGTANNRLTLDHVVPRSRGGDSVWENVVTSCAPCNHRKGNRLPHEVHMELRIRPTPPNPALFIQLAAPKIPSAGGTSPALRPPDLTASREGRAFPPAPGAGVEPRAPPGKPEAVDRDAGRDARAAVRGDLAGPDVGERLVPGSVHRAGNASRYDVDRVRFAAPAGLESRVDDDEVVSARDLVRLDRVAASVRVHGTQPARLLLASVQLAAPLLDAADEHRALVVPEVPQQPPQSLGAAHAPVRDDEHVLADSRA